MVFGEVLGLKIQDRLDAEKPVPASAAVEVALAPVACESFRMLGLYGDIPGSSYEPIRVECWSKSE